MWVLLDVFCKTGKLQVLEEGILRVQTPFTNRVVWQVPCQLVTGFSTQPGTIGSLHVTISTTQGDFIVETVASANLAKLQALFPHLPTIMQAAPPKPKRSHIWYKDETLRAHIAIYTNKKVMQKEVEHVSRYGWLPQATTAQGGHHSATKMVAGAILAGPVGILAGSGRSKDALTITYIRSQEWLVQH